MRIAFLISGPFPSKRGAIGFADELIRRLLAGGHSVDVYCSRREEAPEEKLRGLRVRKYRFSEFWNYGLFSPRIFLDLLRKKYDVIHAIGYAHSLTFLGLLVSKIKKTPFVLTPIYHPPASPMKRALGVLHRFTQGILLLRYSDAVLPITNYERELLLELGGKPEIIKTMPISIDAKFFIASPRVKKERLVLFVGGGGGLTSNKGVGVIFDICGRLSRSDRRVKFVFIGQEPHEAEIRQKWLELRKNPRFTFLSSVGKTELRKWYRSAAVLVQASVFETFGRVLAEAQSCGTAVVATGVGGIPDVVIDGVTGFLIDFGKWDTLEAKVRFLLENPKVAEKMGRAGAEHVRRFDADEIFALHEKLYDTLVSR